MKKIRNKNLFTLLEVLVSMGVFSLLMLALMQFFSAAQGVWEKSGSKSELFDSARIAAQLLTDDLTTAFYGDEYHLMGNENGKYIFYKNETVSSNVHLTFAAQRGGEEGLTAVNYVWNPADLTLSIQQKYEKDATVGAADWVTYPSNSWINAVRTETATPIAENVMYFNVSPFYYNNSATPPANSGAEFRPPAISLVTFAVLSSSGYEKLDTIIRPSVSGETDNAKTTAVKSQIKTYFDAMTPASGSKDKFINNAVPASGSDVPAKQVIFDNVQFFKLIIPIER